MNALTLFLTKNSLRIRANKNLRFDYAVMILGIILSVTVVAAAINLFEGYQETLKKILLDSSAHIMVSPMNATSSNKQVNNQTQKFLKSHPEIEDVQPVFLNNAMVQYNGKVRSCLIKAYNQDSHAKWFGRYVSAGSSKLKNGTLIVGNKLLSDLKAKVGDKITLLYPLTENFSPMGVVSTEQNFIINGIIRTGYYEMDKSLIIMSVNDAFKFFKTDYQVSYLEIMLKDRYVDKAHEFANKYSMKLGTNYFLRSWIDYNGNLFSLIEVEKWLIFLVFSFLILIAALNCVSIVSTTIIDRKKEIAILRTIGVTIKQIKEIVFVRILSICIISIILGLFLGTFTSWLITKQSLYQLKGDVYFIDQINMSVSLLNYGVLFFVAIALIAVCVWLPLKHVNKFEIVEILRGR